MKKWMLMLLPLLASSAQAAVIKYDFNDVEPYALWSSEAPEISGSLSVTIDVTNRKLLAMSFDSDNVKASFNGPAKDIFWKELGCGRYFMDLCEYAVNMVTWMDVLDESDHPTGEYAIFNNYNTITFAEKGDPLSNWWFHDQEGFYFEFGGFGYLMSLGVPKETILSSNPVPEPATFALLGLGLFGLARRKLA